MRSIVILALVLGCLAVATTAAGQEHVRILGRVVEAQTGTPISGAKLTFRNQQERFLRSASTDQAGHFEVLLHRTEAVRIFARRFGYKNNATPLLHFDGHQFYQLEIRLDPEALLLAPLEVIARGGAERSPVLSNYHQRLESGHGHYITRNDVEARNAMFVTDLLREVPGLVLASSGRGSRRTVQMSRTGRNCPVQIYVDGLLLTRPVPTGSGQSSDVFVIDDVVSPGAIEGIEVYRGLSTVPAEFLSPGASCGVVAIWTRRGTS